MSWKKLKNELKRDLIQSDYHKWQYRKYPNLLLAGNAGTGKSRVLYGMSL